MGCLPYVRQGRRRRDQRRRENRDSNGVKCEGEVTGTSDKRTWPGRDWHSLRGWTSISIRLKRTSARENRQGVLLRALVNPCADQCDLLWGQWLWRRAESAGSARSTRRTRGRATASGPGRVRATGSARAARRTIARTTGTTGPAAELTTRPTRPTRFWLRWHGEFVVQPCHSDDQRTLLAIAGNNDFAVFDKGASEFYGAEDEFISDQPLENIK